jgi:hypothetical protein
MRLIPIVQDSIKIYEKEKNNDDDDDDNEQSGGTYDSGYFEKKSPTS